MILDELCDFDQQIFRNVQGIHFEFDEFDDLSDDKDTRAYAHKKSMQLESRFDDNELQYHAIDYVFKRKKALISRYSNGSYPVWYASTDIETSFYESLHHWHKTFIFAPKFKHIDHKVIKALRTVFTVRCRAALIDLRNKAKNEDKLLAAEASNYDYTQKIGARINREGHPGLITASARHPNGENVVLFKPHILSNPSHYNDYIYEYDINTQRLLIRELTTAEEVHLSK